MRPFSPTLNPLALAHSRMAPMSPLPEPPERPPPPPEPPRPPLRPVARRALDVHRSNSELSSALWVGQRSSSHCSRPQPRVTPVGSSVSWPHTSHVTVSMICRCLATEPGYVSTSGAPRSPNSH